MIVRYGTFETTMNGSYTESKIRGALRHWNIPGNAVALWTPGPSMGSNARKTKPMDSNTTLGADDTLVEFIVPVNVVSKPQTRRRRVVVVDVSSKPVHRP